MSKELEALERIRKARYFVDYELDANVGEDYKEELDIVETALKALEIIKEKTLTINDLYWLKNGNYREYRKNLEILYSGVEKEHLQKVLKAKEEYELLKEVLL